MSTELTHTNSQCKNDTVVVLLSESWDPNYLDLQYFLSPKNLYGPVYAILGTYLHYYLHKEQAKLFSGTRGLRFSAKVKFVFDQIRKMADRSRRLIFMVGVLTHFFTVKAETKSDIHDICIHCILVVFSVFKKAN